MLETRPFALNPSYRVRADGRIESHLSGRWRVLKPCRHGDGYRYFYPRVDGVRRKVYVHHAVLLTFVGPRPPRLEARHLDDDPANNRADNLAWGTKAENGRDRAGRHADRLGHRRRRSIQKRYAAGGVSKGELARRHRLKLAVVQCVLKGVEQDVPF